ncbi:hypothetical protein LCGC14_2602550 [marine sediment metagenome]|uniref:Uncharacterized protein n=1 Tax=marine sediment metagenome TaxID=412755 RepID=A0A0F9A8C4_9ZZZZ
MTDKTMREQIAKGNPHPKDEDTTFLTEVGLHDAYMAGVDAALADAKIKEGQKLREKAKSGKLVEFCCDTHIELALATFKDSKRLASGESR